MWLMRWQSEGIALNTYLRGNYGFYKVVYVLCHAPVFYVFFIDFYFVRPEYGVVVLLWIGDLVKDLLLVFVLDLCGTGNAGFYGEYDAVCALELVGITGDVRAWPYETHAAGEDIEELG